MLALLFLAMQVAGEWVEIAQYQNPAGPSRRVTFGHEGATGSNYIYSNLSLTKLPWHRSELPKIPNIDNVKRVHLQNKEIETFTEGTITKAESNNGEYESVGPARAPSIKKENIEIGKLKKISHVDNFRKVYEADSGIHNPSRYFELETEITNFKHSHMFNNNKADKVTDSTYKLIDVSSDLTDFDKDANKKIDLKNASEVRKSPQRVEDRSEDYFDPNQIKHEDVNLRRNTKTNTVEVIFKLMKVVTDNISRHTKRSFRKKLRYLENLRNNIISNIAERLEQAWPEDAGAGLRTEPRETRARRAAHGHVEFPSSESALMTISFLTFAVFLIKLVLVVHTYKNKTMMVTPAVVAAVGRAAASLREQARP